MIKKDLKRSTDQSENRKSKRSKTKVSPALGDENSAKRKDESEEALEKIVLGGESNLINSLQVFLYYAFFKDHSLKCTHERFNHYS